MLILRTSFSFAQVDSTEEIATERQMESMADNDETESEDDSYLQKWEELKRRKLNLNRATEHDLQELYLLTDLQIASFLKYRSLMGKLVNIYELQAISTWDINTIRMVLPFVTTEDTESFIDRVKKRWYGGEKTFLFRSSGVLETAKGFLEPKDSSSSRYLGSPLKLFLRYKYNYKGLLQWGVLGEKDAGEQFFKGAQKNGFDFYSFHFFARKIGKIKELALGDFTVNMGQGLIQWQSLAYNKSANVMAVKRQAPLLRPYNSPGEYNFHRGAAVTVQQGQWEITAFLSLRNRDASMTTDSSGNSYVTSLATSGYHRTRTEVANRSFQGQTALGGSLQYYSNGWKIGFNTIHYQFSTPIQKRDEPYNLYAFKGSSLTNYSIDYNYTYKNIHFFGEIAADHAMNKGMINGMLISLSPMADASLVHRKIDPGFQSMYSSAFTESSTPNNESGLYSGLSLRPFTNITIDAYADVFRFPWLKYLIDAPTFGYGYFAQLTYKPDKQTEIYTRYRNRARQKNFATEEDITKQVPLVPQQNWRVHTSFKVSNTVTLRTRSEMTWYDRNGPSHEEGFSSFVEIFYKPAGKPWSGNFRLQYFDTEGYNSRIYAYENDVLYGATIPALADKGVRYYINARINASSWLKRFVHGKLKVDLYLRWSQTVYDGKETVGSSLDEIDGIRKTDFKCQFMFRL
ncbi:MAG TPA: hypothetical protein VJ647_05375 [Chitinophagaceae bacterium]|nr:hypothetical protein [Chitinophagaceae bacterium]